MEVIWAIPLVSFPYVAQVLYSSMENVGNWHQSIYQKHPQISCTLNLAAQILEKRFLKEIKRNPKLSLKKSSSSTVHQI